MSDEKAISPAADALVADVAPAPERSGGAGGDRAERGSRGDRGDRGGGNRPRRRSSEPEAPRDGLVDKVIFINRSSKVVKGGRRFSFSALVVAGNREGKVGLGLGKGGEVSESIKKGTDNAKTRMVKVSLAGNTIPHDVYSHFGGAKVLLRPASPGTGLICGKTVRAVVESAGVRDILSKSLGSKNAANVAKATLQALSLLRTREQIYSGRGIESRLKKVA